MNYIKHQALTLLCKYNRLHQHFPGRWRLCHWLEKKRPLLQKLDASPAKIAKGTYLYLDPMDYYDGLKYFIHGLNKREPISNIATQLLRPGDCMIDVGANVGYFTALAALTVGVHGIVHSFEASPDTYQKLQVLAKNNLYGNIKTHNYAVSDEDGTVEFHCGPTDHTGISSMRNLGTKTSSTVKTSAIRLDSMMESIPPVRLIKIDVEGAEIRALQGMKSLIVRDSPYVITEVSDGMLSQLGSSKKELVDYFYNLGYSAYRVQAFIVPYVPQDEFQCDILFVPAGMYTPEFDNYLKN
jgi:FkbM family methyltransferase